MNSNGIFLDPQEFHYDIARPGIGLYGLTQENESLVPAVSVWAQVLAVRDVEAGSTIGYGATHRVEKDVRIATLAAGYNEGWLRAQSNQGRVFVAGQYASIVGRVSMDLMGVDVSHIKKDLVAPGQWAELAGANISVHEVANNAKTIPHEILTGLSHHPYKIYST